MRPSTVRGRGARVALTAALAACVMGGSRGRVAPPASPPARSVHVAGPPAAHTGGFGEPTCLQCHNEYELNLPGGSLAVEGLPARWASGERYELVVTLRSSEMARAGFQLSARFEDGTAAGALAAVGPGVAVMDSTGVPYAQHAPDGTVPVSAELALWRLAWTAPRSGGRVLFHAAANSANGDSSPLGDLIYTFSGSAEASSASTHRSSAAASSRSEATSSERSAAALSSSAGSPT